MSARSRIFLWLARSAAGAVALGILIGPLGAGFFSNRLNFTYGARGLDRSTWGRVVLQAILWFAAGVAFDLLVRRGLLDRLRRRMATGTAIVVHLLLLNLVLAPGLWLCDVRTDVLGFGRVLLYENLLQVLFTIAYLGTGSFVFSGALQGAFAALRFSVINDVSGSFETLFFYSYSGEGVGWMLTLSPLLASSWLWIVLKALRGLAGVDENEPHPPRQRLAHQESFDHPESLGRRESSGRPRGFGPPNGVARPKQLHPPESLARPGPDAPWIDADSRGAADDRR